MKVTNSAIEKVLPPDQSMLSQSEWTSLSFDMSGNQILATGKNGLALLLDGFDGSVQQNFSSMGTTCACFTPDDKTVLTGNVDGSVGCWNVATGAMLKKMEGHPSRIGCIASNPKYAMFASCCTNTALWIW